MSEETAMTDIMIIEPARAIARAKQHSDIVLLMQKDKVLRPGADYGVIPGTKKPTLFKPGAERLCTAFGFSPDFELVNSIENWDDEKPMFHYQWKCKLVHIESGKLIASGVGSCNSMESKYRWRWLWPNEVTSMDTSDMVTRQRGSQKQYRIPNDDVFSIVNTIDKMAQKRALIAAVLIGCNASDHFTQDIEDMPGFGTENIVDAEFTDVEPPTPQSKPNGNGQPKSPPTGRAWPPTRIDDLFGYWLEKELTEADICRFAGVTDKYDHTQWVKYQSNQDASAAIQAAWNAEMDNGGSAEESAVFNYMSYVGLRSNLLFATTLPGSENNIVATVFEGRGGIRKWGSDELCEQLQLSQYDDYKGKNIISDWVEMVVPVEFFYVFEQDGNDEYCKITGIKGNPEIAF